MELKLLTEFIKEAKQGEIKLVHQLKLIYYYKKY